MQHQTHFGKQFYIDKETGYWISSSCPKIRAHRWVWINHFGEIEKGFHIHHIDGNKSNNDISNLKKIPAKDHIFLHMTKERKQNAKKLLDIIRPLTKEWHSSIEGKEWHRNHALKIKFGKIEKKCKCDQCNADFITKKLSNTRFCSNKCKSKWRRNSKLDDIEVLCFRCNKKFTKNKYEKQKFCSRKCGSGRRKDKKYPKA